MRAAQKNIGTDSFSNSVIGHEAFVRLVMDTKVDREVR